MLQKAKSLILPISLGIGAMLILSMFIVAPAELGPFGITLWFALLLTCVSGAAASAIYTLTKSKDPEATKVSLRRGLLLGVFVVAALALNSLRQLTPRDIILVVILVSLVDFYSRRI